MIAWLYVVIAVAWLLLIVATEWKEHIWDDAKRASPNFQQEDL